MQTGGCSVVQESVKRKQLCPQLRAKIKVEAQVTTGEVNEKCHFMQMKQRKDKKDSGGDQLMKRVEAAKMSS